MRCKELTLYNLVWVNAYSPYCSLYITQDAGKGNLFDPLHPNNSIDILNTDLSTFPVVMTRRICLTIWSF